MGPFARASKVNSGQKTGGQSSRESYLKGPDSLKETDQSTCYPSKTSKECLPRNISGTSFTRAEDLIYKNDKVHPGKESIHKTCQLVYNPRSRGKKKTKLEDNVDSLGESSIGNTFEKLHVYEVENLGAIAESGNQRSYVHEGSLQEMLSQTVGMEKLDEDRLKNTSPYINRSQYPVAATENVENKAHETDLFVAGQSSESQASLSSLLRLNRIRTRSGPLSEDGSYGSCSIPKSGAVVVEKSSFSEMHKEHGSSAKQVDASMKDFHWSSGGGQCQKSNDQFGQEARTVTSDIRSRDLGTTTGCRVGTSKLQRVALQSQKMSSLARGNLDGHVATVSSQTETHSNLLSSVSQPLDNLQFKSKGSSQFSLKSDHALEKKVSSDVPSCIDCKTPVMEGSYKDLDVINEAELIKFQSVPKISEGSKTKKWPKDIKSFSHELGPRGGRPYGHQRPHSDNDLEELLGALHARFNTAKEEVDSELGVFAGDLIEILDKNSDPFLDWKEKIEDLLILARRCTVMSAADFRQECESIVHDLDDKRQELPMGLLKQLHIRMLFILTRCTRLLQFQKGSSPDEEGVHKVRQCLKGVPSLERAWTSTAIKKGKAASNSKKLLTDIFERTGRNEGKLLVAKHLKFAQKSKFLSQRFDIFNQSNELDSSVALPSPDKSSAAVGEIPKNKIKITDDWVARSLKDSTIKPLQERWDYLETIKTSDDEFQEALAQSATSPKLVEQENIIDEPDSVICRICEEEVPTSQLEAHSFICALADTCDIQGINLDERLRMLADNLEKLSELNTPKSYQPAVGESPESIRPSKFHEASDGTSPKVTDSYGRLTEARLEDFYAVDAAAMEESRGISLLSVKPYLGSKADQVMAPSSTGSGTPRSTLTTPRNSQLDLLWTERNSLTELEDLSQIFELVDIARCVASKSPTEEHVLEYLVACMQDLQEVLGRNKIEALTVDTFGKRIANLLREKYLLICENNDQRRVNTAINSVDEDKYSADDGMNSLKSTPTHPAYKDRTTIDDFEILKPISRGAFGRVFLARKRTTGDLFAIKVLRKIDMIRKNAVENILAERDILISVRNPFVVRFFYSFTCRENLYLVMEYLNGGDLYSLLRNMCCLEENVAKVYIAELVLALEYVHSLGVVHRDLKPDNILIAHDGHIKLTDFGLSKVGLINSTDDLSGPGASGTVLMDEDSYRNSSEHPEPTEHRNRSAVGTPDYLAPEILLGTEHGYTADWWSTGIILFECLSGFPPFNAEHPQIIFDNILNRKVPWPRIPEDMSFEAKDLIDKLLTEDPNQRLGAKGATEVKAHPFFKDINWDTLARQKAAFVPNPESIDDTSYFTSRHFETHSNSPQDFVDSSDCSISSASINSLKAKAEEGGDDFGDLAEFESSPTVKHTFSNFSFKNLSQLASINYDLLLQTGKDHSKGHSRHSSTS